MDKLAQLRTMTRVVADTGDLAAIQALRPVDATTNPSLILKAAPQPQYQALIDEALHFAKQSSSDKTTQVHVAARKVAVNFGVEILKLIPGLVSTEVDAHLSFDTEATLKEAHSLIDLYQQAGVDPNRVLIKIASTWEGIRAAELLEKEGIHCNLTLLFHSAQAKACAEAGVTLISPFVGRIYDWYKAKTGEAYLPSNDPGVLSVCEIFQYYKTHAYSTIVMGASFRSAAQVEALAGCDALTISPALLEALAQDQGPLKQILQAPQNSTAPAPAPSTESAFRFDLNQDPMATEKLAEGIRLFCKDVKTLHEILQLRLG